ncbi:MAG: VOC family protein [Deltaproteobacteria bacterium]|nr:VOC family protein [Deltaproteobacteria bacterium]
MYTGVNHLALTTTDMEATIRFWRDLLGLPLVAGLGERGYRQYFFSLTDRDMVAFFEWPEGRRPSLKDHGVPTREPLAFDHVSIGVESDDDLWVLKDRLEAAGFWVSEVMDHGFIHSIYSFDPNDIPIEFSSPVRGVDLRTRPVMADRNPVPAALEGPMPRPEPWPRPEPFPGSERAVYPGEGLSLLNQTGKPRQSEDPQDTIS